MPRVLHRVDMPVMDRAQMSLGWAEMTPEQILADIDTVMRIFEVATSGRRWPRRVPERLMRDTALSSMLFLPVLC